jgi:hypothetical protein
LSCARSRVALSFVDRVIKNSRKGTDEPLEIPRFALACFL